MFTITNDGKKYLLGVNENNKWFVPNRRFIITRTNNKNTGKDELYGQFLTDMWFNKFYESDSPINLHVFCVDSNVKVQQLMNSLDNDSIIYEKMWSISLNKEQVKDHLKNTEVYETKIIETIIHHDSKIYFKLIKTDEGFTVTHPEFLIVM